MDVPLLPRPVRVAVALAVAAAILLSSVAVPPAGMPASGPIGLVGLDKWLHAVGYWTLAVAVAYAVPARSWTGVAVAVGLAVGFGLLVELLQVGVPYRSFEVVDAAANAVGAAVAGAAWRLLGVGRRLEPAAGTASPTRSE